MSQAADLIISIPDARRHLGDVADSLSDEEVRVLVIAMDELAGLLIGMFKVQKSTQAD
jgi:hypothetical protein